MHQQRTTFEVMFPAMSERGVYICEDACSSYWSSYGGGLRRPGSWVES
jgi:hypothetical protein